VSTATADLESDGAALMERYRAKAAADNDFRRKTCKYMVEATSYEARAAWSFWHDNPPKCSTRGPVPWEEIGLGFWQEIGKFHGHPVCVSVHFAIVCGALVGFYEATSRVVDHDMVKAWVHENFPAAKSWRNAQNFHNTILDIERAKPQPHRPDGGT
jgi:hypothetical protein